MPNKMVPVIHDCVTVEGRIFRIAPLNGIEVVLDHLIVKARSNSRSQQLDDVKLGMVPFSNAIVNSFLFGIFVMTVKAEIYNGTCPHILADHK